ncbi:MAG: hypothetical protein AB9882_06355 [Ignavibacteriaceae bacterium]
MKQVTYYHELIFTGLNNLSDIKNKLNPVVSEYRESYEKKDIDPQLIKKLHKPLAELEKELIHLNKLIRDVCEDCRDIYEEMV